MPSPFPLPFNTAVLLSFGTDLLFCLFCSSLCSQARFGVVLEDLQGKFVLAPLVCRSSMGFVLTQPLRLTPQIATAAPTRQATVAQQFKAIAKKNKFRPKKVCSTALRLTVARLDVWPAKQLSACTSVKDFQAVILTAVFGSRKDSHTEITWVLRMSLCLRLHHSEASS